MKLAVIGATGQTGRLVVAEARRRGMSVIAVARSEATFENGVELRRASVLDADAVRSALSGADAVIWTAGGHDAVRRLLSGQTSQAALCATGTTHVIAAMQRENVRRLICLSSWGTSDSRKRVPYPFRLLMTLMLRHELADKERQEAIVRDSQLYWTIVRPTRMTNDAPVLAIRAAAELRFGNGSRIARANVARFLIDQLFTDQWLQRTVEISQ